MTFPGEPPAGHSNESSVDGDAPWQLETRIESQPENCAKIVTLLLEKLEHFEWENRDAFGIHMAVEEALANAVRHGNQSCPKKDVEILIRLDRDHFYAKITDQGEGFNMEDIPDPTLEENLEKSCGRGVMLIKNFVDQVTYNPKGNSIELKKTRSN